MAIVFNERKQLKLKIRRTYCIIIINIKSYENRILSRIDPKHFVLFFFSNSLYISIRRMDLHANEFATTTKTVNQWHSLNFKFNWFRFYNLVKAIAFGHWAPTMYVLNVNAIIDLNEISKIDYYFIWIHRFNWVLHCYAFYCVTYAVWRVPCATIIMNDGN